MVSGPVDPVWIRRTALAENYDQDSFERAYRLAHLLREIGRDPWLSSRLLLKGGTCINFFHADLPRLSVDMDLNYVGSIDKEGMLAEKPLVMDAIRALARAHGYACEDVGLAYAGWSVRLLYESARGQRSSIKADVNFLQRVALYGVEKRELPAVFELADAAVPCMTVEEVYGGKFAALAIRGEPRDVFDAAHFLQTSVPHDATRLRKAFLFYAHMDDATLRTVKLGNIETLAEKECRDRLYPMLRRGNQPTPREMGEAILPRLKEMLTLNAAEKEFGERLERGEYSPSLLFQDVTASPDIARHPAAEWRRQHPHGKAPDEVV